MDALSYIFSSRAIDVVRLNKIVETKAALFSNASKLSGESALPEVAALVKAGVYDVYKSRTNFFPIIFSLIGLSLIVLNSDRPIVVVTCGILSFFWYDFYSGMLHIVLDNPSFLEFPILGPPCLEFQWHHHIPSDITSKKFLQVKMSSYELLFYDFFKRISFYTLL